MGTEIQVKVTKYNEESHIIDTEYVSAWPIFAGGDIEEDTGICVALGEGRDVVLTEENLLALGYAPVA